MRAYLAVLLTAATFGPFYVVHNGGGIQSHTEGHQEDGLITKENFSGSSSSRVLLQPSDLQQIVEQLESKVTDLVDKKVSAAITTTTTTTTATTNTPDYSQFPKIHIGIISSFDWGEQTKVASAFSRRQNHRQTWMQHPAVNSPNGNGPIKVYFVIGDKQHWQQKVNTTHSINELRTEMEYYQDIALLDAHDLHNYGKMNDWMGW